MKKILLFFAMAVISAGLLTAQVSHLESVNGKEKKAEKTFSEKTTITATPEQKQVKPEYVRQDDGRVIKNPVSKPQKTVRKSEMDLKSVKLNPTVTVRESGKRDVATITFRVIGIPLAPYGINDGFHMLLDADCEMYDNFWDPFWDAVFGDYTGGWADLYASCEYKIPVNASPDINNPNYLLDDEVTIDIPGGIYDFAFVIPSTEHGRPYTAALIISGEDYLSLVGNFMFVAGYEYLFEVEFFDEIVFIPEHDAGLRKVILPPFSTELSNEEEVTVVIRNEGMKPINSDVELSYNVNDGEWITPEILTLSLAPGEEIIYTFDTKADLSGNGLHVVVVHIEYELDLLDINDYASSYTKKAYPRTLPFTEEFDTEMDFIANWTVVNNKAAWPGYTWRYNDWNMDADADWDSGYEHYGALQISCPDENPFVDDPIEPGDDYLITDPIIIPSAGTYNISFWAEPFGYEKVRIVYGTSPNPLEMIELQDFTVNVWPYNIYIKNFEIETPGNYYFAFHYYSNYFDGGWALDFDKVKIDAGVFVGIPDITFMSAFGPVSGCDLGEEGVIGAMVYNRGSEPILEFTLTYQVDGGAIVSQSFTETIDLRESVTVYFDQTFDFSVIGNYDIYFTAETPNEVNINNNEFEITVRHFEPLKDLPFESDFMNNYEDQFDWNSAVFGGWEFSWAGGYYPAWWNVPDVPLVSRCVTLDPDIYRFTFTYTAGYYDWSDDFYVAFGISGTNPYDWAPLKEFFNAHTGNGIILDEESIIFEVSEAGNYAFAFFATRPDGDLCIFGTELLVAPEHDFKLKKVEAAGSFARLTPKYQFEGEKTFIATLSNKGTTANESGEIKLFVNGEDYLTKTFAFSEIGETKQIELKPVFEDVSEGELELEFEASISTGLSQYFEIYKAVSDSTFAFDNIEDNFFDGIGLNVPGGFGNIYELQKEDVLTSINIGFFEIPSIADKEIIIAVYKVNDNYDLGSMIFEEKHVRTAGNNMEGITFDVNDKLLQPGKYFFEIRQLDNVNIAIAYDNEWWGDGHVWVNIPAQGVWGAEDGFGYLHFRPNFGLYGVGISSEKISNSQLTLYPNPTKGQLTIDNGELKIEKITVHNTAGQIVLSVSNVNTTKYSINTEKYSSGLYFVSIQTKSGIVNSKFVVR